MQNNTKDNLKVFNERYNRLNEKQKLAVDTIEGPVLVVAGPGTGKTELLSMRVAKILLQTDTPPSAILCLTFTEAGAQEMRERLLKVIGQTAYKIRIHTFHSFATSIISEYREYFFDGARYSALTDGASAEIFDKIFKSLPHTNPLHSFHPSIGFTYLRDVKDRISLIKEAGYTADEYLSVVKALIVDAENYDNLYEDFWPARLNIKDLSFVSKMLDFLNSKNSVYGTYLHTTLNSALETSLNEGKTESLGEWKKDNFLKNGDKYILKDLVYKEKIIAVAEIYKQYSEELHDLGLYDYTDMILVVAKTLEENAELRSMVEDQFMYILIDEFQDTSDVQMSLVRSITSNEVFQGRPNVCAVGDDDQSIFKFQGADLGNIMHFKQGVYKDVKTIVLDTNYRSTQEIIDYGRAIISQVKNRLETKYPNEITKILKSGNANLPAGKIIIDKYQTFEEEYFEVAKKIKDLMSKDNNTTIAVIAPKHKPLKGIIPYLEKHKIQISYIKKSDVFSMEPIKAIITLIKYLRAEIYDRDNLDSLITEVITAPYWGVKRSSIMECTRYAKENHLTLLESLSFNNDCSLIKTTLETLREKIRHDDLSETLADILEYSPIKNFYFSQEKRKENAQNYITNLHALRSLHDAIEEWKQGGSEGGEFISLKDFDRFIYIYDSGKLELTINERFGTPDANVTLLTAFKSKGLEYDHVFLLQTDDELWNGGRDASLASVPIILKDTLSRAGKTEEDVLRLLFVAITRAKHSLHISYTRNLLRYITESKEKEKRIPGDSDKEVIYSFLNRSPISPDETLILKEMVRNYAMPVTHMQNFLNISNGGPEYFIMQNLLRFPETMPGPAKYGTAMHSVMESIIKNKNSNCKEIVKKKFTEELRKLIQNNRDYKFYLEKGLSNIDQLVDIHGKFLQDGFESEVDTSHMGITLGTARLTGKIDGLKVTNEGAYVLDFKTGGSLNSFDKGTEYEKVKLHRYKEQLMMYKYLIENSGVYDCKVTSLSLMFIDDPTCPILKLDLNDSEYERFKKLVGAVYCRIKNANYEIPNEFKNADEKLSTLISFEEYIIENTEV